MEDNKVIPTQNNDIIDIDMAAIRKKRFRIDHDDNKIIELNTSDLGVLTRLEESYPKLKAHEGKVKELTKAMLNLKPDESVENEDGETVSDDITKFTTALKDVDTDIKNILDYVFNSKVAEICGNDGTMYDPIDGKMRYEHIIDRLMPLYEQNFIEEAKKIRARVSKATAKYTKKKK